MKLEITELADCLQLPLYTVERWIRQGRIPVKKSGGTCLFKRSLLMKWADRHDIPFSLPDERASSLKSEDHIPLVTAMKRGGVYYNIEGLKVNEVLANAAGHIPGFSEDERALLLSKLLEREKLTSTGIGKGVAIPHPRSPLPGKESGAMISTFFLKHEIDFKSLDEKNVSVMFVIVCPSVKSHLHLLSRISFCLRDNAFIQILHQAPSPETLYQTIEEFEDHLEKASR